MFSFKVFELIEPGQHTLLWKMTNNAGWGMVENVIARKGSGLTIRKDPGFCV